MKEYGKSSSKGSGPMKSTKSMAGHCMDRGFSTAAGGGTKTGIGKTLKANAGYSGKKASSSSAASKPAKKYGMGK